MAQRPRIDQLKRTDLNFPTFKQQFESLEKDTQHLRAPVLTRGDLPLTGNRPGSQCLVLEEGVIYYWDEGYQNWRSALGRAFELPPTGIQRYKKRFIAVEGQTVFSIDTRYTVGNEELDVYIQGILQDVNIDYLEVDDRTIEFLSPLQEGMQVTIATPMIVQQSLTDASIQKRLEEIEFNQYQMVMSQYYSGKPVDARGMMYDGFLNTNYIDYIQTTLNVQYDAIRKAMRLSPDVVQRIKETFDTVVQIDPVSTAWIRSSEMTLPLEAGYSAILTDDFSTTDFIDLMATTAYHDLKGEQITTVDTFAGGNHYYKGDFMGTTGNVDRVGFASGITVQLTGYFGSSSGQTTSYFQLATTQNVYGIWATGSDISVINDEAIVYKSVWPYNTDGFYTKGNDARMHRTDGYTDYEISGVNRWFYNRSGVFPNQDGQEHRDRVAYVAASNRVYTIHHAPEAGGKHYQRIWFAAGKTSAFSWYSAGRPSGMPDTVFGDTLNSFTGSVDVIDQIGSTYDHLLIRIGDKLYFLNHSLSVAKTLDWSDAERKPSLFNEAARQMTADRRYLYFPARLLRNGVWGYYLEVFQIEDGAFVDEILVSKDNEGFPGTTAMAFDHQYNRLILGIKGSRWGILQDKNGVVKNVNDVNVHGSYAGFYVFEPPNLNLRQVVSKPIKTNLPQIYYNLKADYILNSGQILFYIRFNNGAWQGINRNTNYSWINPDGAKEVEIQVKAELKSSLGASTSPTLTSWQLDVRQFQLNALMKTRSVVMDLEDVTGGEMITSDVVPSETSLNWSIALDTDDPEYVISQDGLFNVSDGLADGDVSVYARMGTNNKLLSPVVRDFQVQFQAVAQGVLESTVADQLIDLHNVDLWVLTGSTHEYYAVSVSRNGGETWVSAAKNDAVKQPDGKVETLWKAAFTDDTGVKRRDFKVRFELNGVTDLYQYGAMFN